MIVFMSYFLPLYFLTYFLLAFVLKSLIVAVKLGKSPLVLPADDDAYGLVGKYFKWMIFTIFLYLLALLFYPNQVFAFGAIPLLVNPIISYLGYFMLVLAFVITIKAQYDMKDSWRIGIDTNSETALITQGLFKLSRNLIFLGMLLAMLGLFLLLPSLPTLSLFVVTYILINIQVRLEEAFLLKRHGKDYEDYFDQASRFL